ncbi:DUF6221 family protein [Streptomyces sp. C]|uniref:DUF6221 family protein n=1 Tax=Streptomyces sp. C TaxID=253839 RepID=UPI0001B4F28B|nr:DUF6221 family protein [Streptomyces sp. C]EFL19903.1 predicted protein [Streptomyces sp. C]
MSSNPALVWIAFLRARVEDERSLAQAAGAGGWWEPTGPGIAVDGRITARILTGAGVQTDHDVAMHVAAHQPHRVLADLDAKERLLDLCERQGGRLAPALLDVVVAFAEPFQDHPDHPENSREES